MWVVFVSLGRKEGKRKERVWREEKVMLTSFLLFLSVGGGGEDAF